MISDGKGGYIESGDSVYPTDMLYNEEKSGCIDVLGNVIDGAISYNDGQIVITTNMTSKCFVYFDEIPNNPVKLNVYTNGVLNTLPTTNGYKASLSCSDATATFSDRYQRVEISQLGKNPVCNLNYNLIDTNVYTKLTTEVQNKATQISSINNAGETDISYRYNGKNPNNYIWFNNEMWRIIGLIPTCTSSGCATKSNLVKIIRNESLGGYAYDASSTTTSELKNAWGSNTLYKLLNEYYYGKGNGTSNENGKAYCYGYYNSTYQPIPDCNFNEIGISNNEKDYFGTMIENVYWNTGKIPDDSNISEIYINETATQTVLGYVGLMTASDYGYAGTDYNNVINSSLFGNNTTTNWLYGNGDERTSIGSLTKTTSTIVLTYWGTLENNSIHISYAVRPVVYLDPSVYVISGEGTEENPYIIGM